MARAKKLPKELLVRWNDDNEDAYLEVSETLNDVNIGTGDETTIGVYTLNRTTQVRSRMEMD